LERIQRQSFSGLAVGAGAFVHPALVLEGEEGLELANDSTARAFGVEDLVKEAKEGAAHAKDALSAIGTLIGLGKQAWRQEGSQQQLQVAETLLAEVLHPAA
jgi:hypothetical protein